MKGKRYLDFISQLYNAHIGLNNPGEIIEAAKRQLDEMATLHTPTSTCPRFS